MRKRVIQTAATALLLLVSGIASAAADLEVKRQVNLAASKDTVWKLLGGFNHIDVWHPAVVDSRLREQGRIRVLTLGNGAKIVERQLDGKNNSYSYTITQSPLPLSNYVATIRIEATGEQSSRVVWSSKFQANGVEDKEASKIVAGIYEAGLSQLGKIFGMPKP